MSRHREYHGRMLASLEQAYRDEGDTTTQFHLSFLDDEPRPDAAVIQALNDGAGRIILCEVFLTLSNHTVEGEDLVEALQVEKQFDVEVLKTGPLWDSQLLRSMSVARANADLGGRRRDEVAVLLVAHGQPDEWDVEWGTETEHEIAFREGVLDLLAADGYRADLLGLAWMEFKDPKPAGATRLLFFSAAISAESIHSQYDVPELVG